MHMWAMALHSWETTYLPSDDLHCDHSDALEKICRATQGAVVPQ